VNLGVAPSILTVRPEADAHVTTSSAGKNYGTVKTLRVREDPSSTYRSYLNFTVSGIDSAVRSAKLRLYVTNASPDGGAIYAVGNGWTKAGITSNSAPPIAGTPVASTGSVALNTRVDVDVTVTVTGNGIYSVCSRQRARTARSAAVVTARNPRSWCDDHALAAVVRVGLLDWAIGEGFGRLFPVRRADVL
jgi:hypothetical protein